MFKDWKMSCIWRMMSILILVCGRLHHHTIGDKLSIMVRAVCIESGATATKGFELLMPKPQYYVILIQRGITTILLSWKQHVLLVKWLLRCPWWVTVLSLEWMTVDPLQQYYQYLCCTHGDTTQKTHLLCTGHVGEMGKFNKDSDWKTLKCQWHWFIRCSLQAIWYYNCWQHVV